jgi:DNA-binding MarR family transcriptional regulator
MDNLQNAQKLRGMIKTLVRNLGILEKGEASCCGITLGQCHAIVEIGSAHSISLNDLAELLHLDNSTMSRTVNNLVNQDLAEREIDPNDRRYIKIKLTDQGKEAFQSIEESMNEYFQSILESIPNEKREQVIESLFLLANAVKNNKCC